MKIQYQFDVDKAVAAMVAILRYTGPTDKLKLIKLLYLADRDCFLSFGHPITGDQPVAMDHGPVPSGCLDVLNGEIESQVFSVLHVTDCTVALDDSLPPNMEELTDDESRTLKQTLDEYGRLTTGQLYRLVHELPEYRDCHIPGTSADIPFERILQHHGTEDQFRHGRPVVTRKMRRHLACPFPQSETPI